MSYTGSHVLARPRHLYDAPIRRHRPLLSISGNQYITLQERSIVNFATIQLFALLYLEKFALGPLTFQVNVPVAIYGIGSLWMTSMGRVGFSKFRLSVYFLMVGCCVFSAVVANAPGSIPSMLQLFLIYSFFTTSQSLPEPAYNCVLNRFIWLMVPIAVIGIAQWGIQKLNGGAGDPISMTGLVPEQFLQQGYYYEAHYPVFSSPFQRPNGFFMLEPSFFSFFTACAAVIEIAYFRRKWVIGLMVAATMLSFGGTGAAILALASPFLFIRENPKIAFPVGIAVIVGLAIAYSLGAPIPLLSRMDELNTGDVGGGGSGMLRLTLPWNYLIDRLSDTDYLFTGTGPGSTAATLGSTSAWPALKMINEYGLVTTIVYLVLFMSAFTNSSLNLALKFAIIVIFHITGGNLVDGVTIQFFLLIFLIEPDHKPIRE